MTTIQHNHSNFFQSNQLSNLPKYEHIRIHSHRVFWLILHCFFFSTSPLLYSSEDTRTKHESLDATGAEVRTPPDSISQQISTLELLLNARVFVHYKARDVEITLSTTKSIQQSESLTYVESCLGASDLLLIPVPSGYFICRTQDKREALQVFNQTNGETQQTKITTFTLSYADVNDVYTALRQTYQPTQSTPQPQTQRTNQNDTSTKNLEPLHNQPPTTQIQQQQDLNQQQPTLQTFNTPTITITADPINRNIIVTSDTLTTSQVRNIINTLDRKPQQVFIDVVIGEYTQTDGTLTGVQWGQALAALTNKTRLQASIQEKSGSFLNPSSLVNGVAGLNTYIKLGDQLSSYAHLNETNNTFTVIQQPTLSALNHTPTRIYMGEQIAIASQTLTQAASNTQTATLASNTQYIPVRLQLDITPHIYSGNEIRLEFKETHNTIEGYSNIGGNSVPNISDQGIQNTLIVQDGATVLLGGLQTTSNQNDSSGVPVITKLPLIGRLFSTKNKQKTSKQLLVFIRPNIMKSKETIATRTKESIIDMDGITQPINQSMKNITRKF